MDLILKAITYNFTLLCRLFSGAHDLTRTDKVSEITRLMNETYHLFILLNDKHQVTDSFLAGLNGNTEAFAGDNFYQEIQRKLFTIMHLILHFRNDSAGTYESQITSSSDLANAIAPLLASIAGINNDFRYESLEQLFDNNSQIERLTRPYVGRTLPPLLPPERQSNPAPPLPPLTLMRSTPMQEVIVKIVSHFETMRQILETEDANQNLFYDELNKIGIELFDLQMTIKDLQLIEDRDDKYIAVANPQFPANIDSDFDLKLLKIVFRLFVFCHSEWPALVQRKVAYQSLLINIKELLPEIAVHQAPPIPAAVAAARSDHHPLTQEQRLLARRSAALDDDLGDLQRQTVVLARDRDPFFIMINELNQEDKNPVPNVPVHPVGISRYSNDFISYVDAKFPLYSANSLADSIIVAEGPKPVTEEENSAEHACRFFMSLFCSPAFDREAIGAMIVAGKPNERNAFLNYFMLSEPLRIQAKVKALQPDHINCTCTIKSTLVRKHESGNIIHYKIDVAIDINDVHVNKSLALLHLPNFKDFSVTPLTQPDIKVLHDVYDEIRRANNHIVIHCAAGRGRSGTLAMAYLLANRYNNYYENNGDPRLTTIKELLGAQRKRRPRLVMTADQLRMAVDLAKQFHVIDQAIVEQKRVHDLEQKADRTNDATLHFTLGRDRIDQRTYNAWYSDTTLRHLMHLHYFNQSDAVAYVFETQYKKGFSLAEQLSALVMFKNKERRSRACFILTEPGANETSHYIFGVITDKIVLFINPTGLSNHPDFYAQLNNIHVAQVISSRKIFMSTDVLQRDEHGLVSCGPISAELAMAFAAINAEQLERALITTSFTTEKHDASSGNSVTFNAIQLIDLNKNIKCLTELLEQLLRVKIQHYKAHIENIRRGHLEALRVRLRPPMTWDNLYNAPPQVAIARHCTGDQPIFQQGGGYDPLAPQLLKSNRAEINCAIELIFRCIETSDKDSEIKIKLIKFVLKKMNDTFPQEFKLYDGDQLKREPIVALSGVDSRGNQNQEFNNLFRAFSHFINTPGYRQTLLDRLPDIRQRFELPPNAEVLAYAKNILQINEQYLTFLRTASTLNLPSPHVRASVKQPTSVYHLPAAESPLKTKKSKSEIKRVEVNPQFTYADWHITTAVNAVIRRPRINGGIIGEYAPGKDFLLAGLNTERGTYNEEDSSNEFFVAVTPAVMRIPVVGINCTPIDYWLDKNQQGRDALAGHLEELLPHLNELKTYKPDEAKVKREIERLVGRGISSNDRGDTVRKIYNVLVESSYAHELVLQKVIAIDRQKNKSDVFDELGPILKNNKNCRIKILFPYNENSSYHWQLGEIKIHKAIISPDQVQIAVDIYAHDPFGGGKMSDAIYNKLCVLIDKKIKMIYENARLIPPIIMFNHQESRYLRRQASGDTYSCGAIVADDLIYRILGHSLNGRLFPVGAVDLRQKQLSDVTKPDHTWVPQSSKTNFYNDMTRTSTLQTKHKIEPRSVAYTIDNMNTVIEATKNADFNEGGLACHTEKGCTYLLHDVYPEHKSDDQYHIAILPAVALTEVGGDPSHVMPIDTYLDRTKNVDANVKYLLNAISNAITGKRHSLSHIRSQTLETFELMMEREPYKSLVIDPAIRDRVFQATHAILNDRDFTEEKLASLITLEEIEKHADVFEDLQQLFNTEPVCNVKILFPVRLFMQEDKGDVMRHLLVEIKIHRNDNNINVDIWGHDPRGIGILPHDVYSRLAGCVHGRLARILPGATITINRQQNPSPFKDRRVAHGDRSTAPAIVVEELFCRTRGEPLTKSYPATAEELRIQHATRVLKLDNKVVNRKAFLRHQMILHTTQTGFGLQMEQVKPVTADGKLNLAYVVYKLRGICKELLNDPVDQPAVDKKFAKLISAFMIAQNNCKPNDSEQLAFFNADGSAKNPPSILTGNPIRDRVIAGCFDIYQLLYIISINEMDHKNRRVMVKRILASLEKLQADSRKLLPPKKDFVKGPTSRVTDVRLHVYQDETSGEVIGKTVVQKEITGVLRRTRIDSVKRWTGIVGGAVAATGLVWFLTAVIGQHFPLELYVIASVVIPVLALLAVGYGTWYVTRKCCLRPYTAQTLDGDRFSLFAIRSSIQGEPSEKTALIGELPSPPPSYATRTPLRTRLAAAAGQISEEDAAGPVRLPTLEDAEEGRVAQRERIDRRPQALTFKESAGQRAAARLSSNVTANEVMSSAKAQAAHRMSVLFPGTRVTPAAAAAASADLDLPADWQGMLEMGDRSTLRRPVDPNLIAAVQRAAATLELLRNEVGGSDPDAIAALDDLVDPEALARAAARPLQ